MARPRSLLIDSRRGSCAIGIARIAVGAIEPRYRRLARRAGLRAPRGGAVVVLQRFGSDLRLNLHLHGLHPDGAWGRDERGAWRFFRAPAPSPAEVEHVLARIVGRVSARLESGEDDDLPPDDEDDLALVQACAWLAFAVVELARTGALDAVRAGGLVFYGSIPGGLAAAWLAARLLSLDLVRLLDLGPTKLAFESATPRITGMRVAGIERTSATAFFLWSHATIRSAMRSAYDHSMSRGDGETLGTMSFLRAVFPPASNVRWRIGRNALIEVVGREKRMPASRSGRRGGSIVASPARYRVRLLIEGRRGRRPPRAPSCASPSKRWTWARCRASQRRIPFTPT